MAKENYESAWKLNRKSPTGSKQDNLQCPEANNESEYEYHTSLGNTNIWRHFGMFCHQILCPNVLAAAFSPFMDLSILELKKYSSQTSCSPTAKNSERTKHFYIRLKDCSQRKKAKDFQYIKNYRSTRMKQKQMNNSSTFLKPRVSIVSKQENHTIHNLRSKTRQLAK